MARLIRKFDWSSTPLGPTETWPQSLKTVTSLVLHSSLPMVLLWGPEGIMIYNDGYRDIAAGRHPGVLGARVREAWPEAEAFNHNVMKVCLGGASLTYQDQPFTLYRTGRPEKVWLNLDYAPVIDETGRPGGVIAIVVDTTARVLADRRIQSEQARQRRMLRQMPGFAAVLLGRDLVFDYANDAYFRIAQRSELIGRRFREVFPELEGQGIFEKVDHAFQTGESVILSEAPFRLDGSDGPQYATYIFEPLRDDDGAVTGIFISGYEVTETRRVTEALRASEARLLALNAGLEEEVKRRTHVGGKVWTLTPAALSVFSPEGVLETINPAWKPMLGWEDEDILGLTLFDLLHPDDVDMVRANFDRLASGEIVVGCDCRLRCKDGGYRWLSWFAVPDEGKVYSSARDVTVAKAAEAELLKAQDALRQAQKMEAVGQLTGGLAHDFNNLLGGIIGALEVLEQRLAEGRLAGVERYINMAQTQASRAAALTQRLLAFSRRQTLDSRPTDLNQLVGGMEDLIRRTVGPAITVEVVKAAGLWATEVDASQTESALLNLVINARDAMPGGGRLTIETANRWLDEQSAGTHDLPPGQYVSLCVSDTGTGIPPELIDRVFDPFFTTKPLGQGTGLGLSMIHGFVRQSGGQVRLCSEPGRGTTMCLYLPRHTGEWQSEPQAEAEDVSDAAPGETVLVIDDEIAIRLLVVEVLEDAGYRVLDAADGPSGLKILQSDARIDLLITDVGLPGGLNGRQVADAARQHRPGLKVLFITGYAENAAVGHGHLETGMQVMTKPFAMKSLAGRVRGIIES